METDFTKMDGYENIKDTFAFKCFVFSVNLDQRYYSYDSLMTAWKWFADGWDMRGEYGPVD